MNALVEIFLALIELIKAEVNQSKVGFFSFLTAIFLCVVGMIFLTGAIGLMLVSVGLALNSVLSSSVSILITGFITLLIAGILLFLSFYKIKE